MKDWKEFFLKEFFLGAAIGFLFGLITAMPVKAAELTPQEIGEIVAEAASAVGKPAARLTPEQAQSIYAVAYGQCPKIAGMSNGCPSEWYRDGPKVHVVHPQYGCGIMGQMPDCDVLAVYSSGYVFLSQEVDMSTLLGASVLLHEYIHHFQWLRNGKKHVTGCEAWLADEREAYAIEVHVLQAAGQFALADEIKKIAAQQRCLHSE